MLLASGLARINLLDEGSGLSSAYDSILRAGLDAGGEPRAAKQQALACGLGVEYAQAGLGAHGLLVASDGRQAAASRRAVSDRRCEGVRGWERRTSF